MITATNRISKLISFTIQNKMIIIFVPITCIYISNNGYSVVEPFLPVTKKTDDIIPTK